MLDSIVGAVVIGGIAMIVCEWAWPSVTLREHHAWRMAGYALAAAGFAAWTVLDLGGPWWRFGWDGLIAVGNAVRAVDEYRKWRDAGGPPKRRLRALSERLRARFAAVRSPARIPVPT